MFGIFKLNLLGAKLRYMIVVWAISLVKKTTVESSKMHKWALLLDVHSYQRNGTP